MKKTLVAILSLFASTTFAYELHGEIGGKEFIPSKAFVWISDAMPGEAPTYTLVFGNMADDYCITQEISSENVRVNFRPGPDVVGKYTHFPLFQDSEMKHNRGGRGLLVIKSFDGEFMTGTILTDRNRSVDFLRGDFEAFVCN